MMNPGRKRLGSWYWVACALVWLAGGAGCGSGLTSVEGTVTFDGQPIESGSIVLEPADGAGPTAGGQIEQGKYQLANVAPGKKIVRITAIRKTGRQVQAGLAPSGQATGPSAPGGDVEEVEQFIPVVYNQNSTLTCEVGAGGASQHNFDLKADP